VSTDQARTVVSASFVGRDLDGAHLVGEAAVRGVNLDCCRLDRREPSRERVAQLVLERERRTVLDHDVLEPRDGGFPLWCQRLNAQALQEPAKHLVHELRKAGVREPVVERLVGNRDVVLVIELAQQVGDRLDLSTGKTGYHREEQAVRRDGTEPLTLPGSQAELVDVVGGQRARAHPAS
jgi:hypothetical protein